MDQLPRGEIRLVRQSHRDLLQAVRFCPPNLKWRLFLVAARFAALLGDLATCSMVPPRGNLHSR